jgi:hypothetical protein
LYNQLLRSRRPTVASGPANELREIITSVLIQVAFFCEGVRYEDRFVFLVGKNI